MIGSAIIHDHEIVTSRQRTTDAAIELLMIQKGVPRDECSIFFKFLPELAYRVTRIADEQATRIEWEPLLKATP